MKGLYDEDGIDGPFERAIGQRCWCCKKPRSNQRCASRCEIVQETVNGGQVSRCLTHDNVSALASWEAW